MLGGVGLHRPHFLCVDPICGRLGIKPSPIVRELQAILGERSNGDSIGNSLRMSLERAIDYIDSDEYVESNSEISPPVQTHPKCYYAQASRKPELYDMRMGPSSSRARSPVSLPDARAVRSIYQDRCVMESHSSLQNCNVLALCRLWEKLFDSLGLGRDVLYFHSLSQL